MSMQTYPMIAPVAFIIDAEVTAYLMLSADKAYGTIPEEVQKLLDEGKFDTAVKNGDKILQDSQYFDIDLGEEILSSFDVDHSYTSEFEGAVYSLDRALEETGKEETFSEDFIAFIEPRFAPGWFSAPYQNVDELLAEFKSTLAPLGAFPPDFDWASKLVKIEGSYFA